MWTAAGIARSVWKPGAVTLLRGRRLGLEVALAGRELEAALDELAARLAERPGFYRGTPAVVNFGATPPSSEQYERLCRLLSEAGVELRAVGGAPEIEAFAAQAGLPFESLEPAAPGPEPRRHAFRARGEVKLSEAARNLVADFAGARADIADRRRRGDSSVRRADFAAAEAAAGGAASAPAEPAASPALHVVETPPGTLYHSGTLRGGQALAHQGNVVVVGDVNPGAELIATGDIVVFGRLAGVAHAGAQGDAAARVYALTLAATQLRIATFIAAEHGERPAGSASRGAEVALVRDGRIVVVSYDHIHQIDA